MIWHQRGGQGPQTLLLLHGLGATGAVWNGVCRSIEARGTAQWIVADLSGHGGSGWRSTYSVGELAADLVPLLQSASDVGVIGHSLGTYVGLALAGGWFGVRIRAVLGVGPKVTWRDEDLQVMSDLAARPARCYGSEAEALARYRRVSGITEDIASGTDVLARGVAGTEEGFRLSQDPQTFRVGGAPFRSLISSATCPVLLARGERDQMVSTAELQVYCADAITLAGVGHNAHIEKPDEIVDLMERLSINTR